MTINTTSSKKSLFDGRKMWFAFGAASAVLVAILTFFLMSKVVARETYYVLNTDVAARYQITPDMLTPVDVPQGGIPTNALGYNPSTGKVDLSRIEYRWAKYTLLAGDYITEANTTPPEEPVKLTAGLPSDFVITSFSADPNLSAGGNARRGDYIDIAVVSSDASVTGNSTPTATFILQHVLVIDANAGAGSVEVDQATGTVSGIQGRDTVPTLYTVGLSPENALRLIVAQQNGTLYVVLSSQDTVNNDINPYPGSVSLFDILTGAVPDGGEGTDPQFGYGGNNVSTPSNPSKPEPSTPSRPTPTPSAPSTSPSPTPTDEVVEEEEVVVEDEATPSPTPTP
jgi:pilus assembly protein CpaB